MADEILKHEIVADLKRVAAELGHSPSRREYLELGKFSRTDFEREFGLWTNVSAAAFGDQRHQGESNKKRVEAFFSRDVKELIKRQSDAAKLSVFGVDKTIVAIPDLHAPWIHQDSLQLLYVLLEILKPDYVVALGDEYDFFSFGKFPRSHMIIKPDDEVRQARLMLEEMWKNIRSICPKSELISLTGNHTIRPFKRILESTCPELEVFMDFKSLFTFDGVRTIYDPREVLMIEGIHFTHGHLNHGSHRSITNTHCVHGHTHNSGLIINKVAGKLLWELDCGYLGNPIAPCFGYTPKKITKWTRGIGYISHLGPMFIPFE